MFSQMLSKVTSYETTWAGQHTRRAVVLALDTAVQPLYCPIKWLCSSFCPIILALHSLASNQLGLFNFLSSQSSALNFSSNQMDFLNFSFNQLAFLFSASRPISMLFPTSQSISLPFQLLDQSVVFVQTFFSYLALFRLSSSPLAFK